MRLTKRLTVLGSFGCAVLLVSLVAWASPPVYNTAAETACPPGQAPLTSVSLAQLPLPATIPAGAQMMLSRITLEPGETLEVTPAAYTAYNVESGVLKYPLQPGLKITRSPQCASGDDHFSGGGITEIDANMMVSVYQGEALIAEDVLTGPITSGGTVPLLVLQMMLVPGEIDPATGLPVVDPATAGREAARAFEQRKQACKVAARSAAAGTPVTSELIAPAQGGEEATPASGGWAVDASGPRTKIPKACRRLQESG